MAPVLGEGDSYPDIGCFRECCRSPSTGVIGAGPVTVDARAKTYSSCAKLNKVYPHGVGKPGAKDLIGGKYRPGRSVTNFTKNRAVYNANTARDGDKDGVACEKR